MLLHTDAFTHISLYSQTLLHADPFTRKQFYTQKFLHTDFMRKGSYESFALKGVLFQIYGNAI